MRWFWRGGFMEGASAEHLVLQWQSSLQRHSPSSTTTPLSEPWAEGQFWACVVVSQLNPTQDKNLRPWFREETKQTQMLPVMSPLSNLQALSHHREELHRVGEYCISPSFADLKRSFTDAPSMETRGDGLKQKEWRFRLARRQKLL